MKKYVILFVALIACATASGCSYANSNTEQKAETKSVQSTTSRITETTQKATEKPTDKTDKAIETTVKETNQPKRNENWLTICSTERESDSFTEITSCQYTGFDYDDMDTPMTGPVIYGTISFINETINVEGFASSLFLPDGSAYTGYDFVTQYDANQFSASIPQNLPSGDYTFELTLYSEDDTASVNRVMFSVNQ